MSLLHSSNILFTIMCGVFGYVGILPTQDETLLQGLRELEYRGYDSWGLAWQNNGQVKISKDIGKVPAAGDSKFSTTCAIGHTRWATHGGIKQQNAHPHLDCAGHIALIHNGIIENYIEVKNSLKKNGHKFISETDSEVAVHLIEQYHRSLSLEKSVQKAFKKIKGLNAFVVMNQEENKLVACKNSSPLVVGKSKDKYFVASDVHALASHTEKVYFLQDNDLAVITPNKFELYDISNLKLKKANFRALSAVNDVADKGKFAHFLIKEINEQKDLLAHIVKRKSEIESFANFMKKYSTVELIGCGTAYYAALLSSYFLSNIADRTTYARIASEFENYNKKSFPVFFSQSGETIDIILTAKAIAQKGGKIGALVNREQSTLARMANTVLPLQAGIEKSVLATKSFFTKTTLMYLVANSLNGTFAKAAKELEKSEKDLGKILSTGYYKKYIAPVVAELKKATHVFVIGRGACYPLSLEAALKLKESSYIHAEGFAGGELKHGVIALIEQGVPSIVLAPNDDHYEEIISNAIEIKSRGGSIIGISHKNHPCFDYFLPINKDSKSSFISITAVAQLIAYYTTISLGRDPDKPRNLAKSVTVK